MASVRRYDRGTLKEPRPTTNGGLRVEGYASRAGIFEYRDSKGNIRRELRDPSDVFDPKSLATYDTAPITLEHPNDWVTPKNKRQLAVGTVTEPARKDDEMVAMSSVIDDAEALKAIENKTHPELSVGYTTDLDPTPGVHPIYGRYDARQKNIVVNHVALVRSGRAGHEARLRLDDAEMITDADLARDRRSARPETVTDTRSSQMKITEEEFENLKKQLVQVTARADKLETDLRAANARADSAEGSVVALTADVTKLRSGRIDPTEIEELKTALTEAGKKIDAADKARRDATAPAVIDDLVDHRLDVVRDVLEIDPDFRWPGLTNRQVMDHALLKLNGASPDRNLSDDFVAGQFKHAMEGHRAFSRQLPRVDRTVIEPEHDEREDALAAAREKQKQRGLRPLPNDRRNAGKES